jgi:hypothetical protein
MIARAFIYAFKILTVEYYKEYISNFFLDELKLVD